MPLLGGLFHKRGSAKTAATSSVASSASTRDSADGDYVLPDRPAPIYSLPASASKLRLPFRRKQPLAHSPALSLDDAPSPPRISSVMSDSGHGLPAPPRKSSVFAAYNSSHHSLPNEPSSRVHPDTPARLSCSDVHPPPAGHAHKKSVGLFSWARERTKSKPPLPPPSSSMSSVPTTSTSTDDSSFNLRSFRHVGADSSATSPDKSPQPSPNSLLPPARPRSRGDSLASDSSQRISVAAFREAQARSRTNSPAPSFRPPSTADTLRVDGNGRKRASTVSVVSGADRPPANKNVCGPPVPSPRPDPAADTSSDSESSDDDQDVDSDGEPIPKPPQKRTPPHRVDAIRARSDTGHGSVTASIGQASHARQDSQTPSKSTPPPTYRAPFVRTRASSSTSASAPSGAARTASILATASSSGSSQAQSRHPPRKPKGDSDESTDSSDTDSEDMPLSDLVPPRRPGSSASNQSNGRSRVPAKPLIDINSLTGGQPLLKPILRHQNSVRDMSRQERDVEKDQPFSIPAALALSSSTSPPITPSVSKQNVVPHDKSIPALQNRRSSGDVPPTAKSEGLDIDHDLMNAIRLVGALDKEQDPPSGTTMPSNHIMPTPIREREPPTSFTVLSRPPHRQSTAETSSSFSPASQTHSVTTPPVVSSQHESGTRQRAPAMVRSPAESDKSDALSIASAARSARSSSRIPPVPLIHSIPDSPSVKEDYKPGRPRSASASRTSAVSTSESRSKPVPAMSSPSNKTPSHGFQPSAMPQPPFASNHPIRGESPAGSSTGDSSSGRAPFTPRDGSDIGTRSKDDASDMDSTLKARGHAKKLSVTFEELQPVRGRERAKAELTSEERTRERRRSEAKAALELGKVVNGRRPLVHDGSDEDTGPRGRNPKINVTLDNNGVPGMMPGWAPWQQPMGTGMNPMVPPQFGSDPAYLAAHQQALLVAKQAYQMAVAQQAMQMAGEEWERGSNIGFSTGGSVYGGGSGGSVYGAGSGGSMYGGAGGMAPMGMMGMPNMGMLMPPNQWGRSSVAFPGAPGSVYGGLSSSQSEIGGSAGGAWATRSAYGDSFGSSSSRGSFAGNGGPGGATNTYGGSRPRARTGVSPPSATSRTPGKSPAVRNRAAPPSSWKSGR